MINKWAYIWVGLYSGGGGGAYIWNEVSVSTCGGLIFGGGAWMSLNALEFIKKYLKVLKFFLL